jgi:hypothetical protein
MSDPYGRPAQPPVQYVGQPPVHYVQSSTNGLAVTSMVLGIVGLLSFGFVSIGAIITGHLALAGQKAKDGFGRGQAIAGLIMGYLPVLGWLLFWIVVIVIGVGAGSNG